MRKTPIAELAWRSKFSGVPVDSVIVSDVMCDLLTSDSTVWWLDGYLAYMSTNVMQRFKPSMIAYRKCCSKCDAICWRSPMQHLLMKQRSSGRFTSALAGVKARAYYSDSVIRNLTPSLRRTPRAFTVLRRDVGYATRFTARSIDGDY